MENRTSSDTGDGKMNKNKQNAVETYRKYKQLKKKLGIPERYPLDPEKIREDLSSERFFGFG
jgi:hypothetical protein